MERPLDVFEGRAVDVEADGRLVVIDDCAITHRIDSPRQLTSFNLEGYRHDAAVSGPDRLVFRRRITA